MQVLLAAAAVHQCANAVNAVLCASQDSADDRCARLSEKSWVSAIHGRKPIFLMQCLSYNYFYCVVNRSLNVYDPCIGNCGKGRFAELVL